MIGIQVYIKLDPIVKESNRFVSQISWVFKMIKNDLENIFNHSSLTDKDYSSPPA